MNLKWEKVLKPTLTFPIAQFQIKTQTKININLSKIDLFSNLVQQNALFTTILNTKRKQKMSLEIYFKRFEGILVKLLLLNANFIFVNLLFVIQKSIWNL